MATGLRMTVEEYLSLPEEKPYREYVDGEVLTKAMPNTEHGELVDAIAAAIRPLKQRLGGRSGPEIRARFETERGPAFRLPDYGYWLPERAAPGPGPQNPPTLAVEVRSPEEPLEAQREKCRWMRRYGVDACWLIDPGSRTVELFEAGREGVVLRAGAVLTSAHLPGFELPLSDLFAALD